MKDFHKQMSIKLGTLKNVDKAIQELEELQENLRDWKILYLSGNENSSDMKHILDNIQEERIDVSVMMQRLDCIFNFTKQDNKNIAVSKINRTIERYLV